MTELLESEAFGTVMGGILLLGLVVLVWKAGPLRVLGELAAHAVFTFVALVVAGLILWFFAVTTIGQSLGGIATGVTLILISPFIMIAVGIVQSMLAGKKKKDDSDVF
ncbi:MAG: hypothetical protein AB8B85_13360 [Paracoccaceae bacterium]